MNHTLLLLVALFLLLGCSEETTSIELNNGKNWSNYQGDKNSNQYSPLKQINKDNVQQLKVAWSYASGDADTSGRTQIQCNPLIIDGILYGSSPTLQFFALDASSGKELWRFNPFEEAYDQFGMGVNRGLSYWTNGQEKRLFFTAESFLYCLNAKTGQLIPSFGKKGRVALHEGLGRDVEGLYISSNTPGIIYQDKLILGMRVSESIGHVPGHIRAYNVQTGAMEWIFHTIPHPGEDGYDTWPEEAWKYSGGANAWAGLSLDEERGIVFIPTGSASFDFYGGDRHGDNLFANCLLALDANTGERIWHYQTVHHDLWDRDLPAPPNLIQVTHNGKTIDAVAQITKSAHIFVFNRETGEPLFPIEEVAVPPSLLFGEQAAKTQPIPTKPLPFSRQRIQEADLPIRSTEAYTYAKEILEKSLEGDPFIPPSEQETILFPGFDGGGEWGGAAFDPEQGNLIINASEMPWLMQMVPYEQKPGLSTIERGKSIYNTHCLQCHGKDLKGASVYTVPTLVGLKDRLDKTAVISTIQKGKGSMPSFSYLSEQQSQLIAAFLLEEAPLEEEIAKDNEDQEWPYPYYFNGYNRLKAPDGYPAIKPPWGTLNAVNLNTGELAWKVTLGAHPELTEQGMPATGTENYGGPVVTAGGLVFIAATMDEKIRAFDKDTGAQLWEAPLPAAGFATPAVYETNGKQYIVIACGGGKLGMKSGDQYVAFSL